MLLAGWLWLSLLSPWGYVPPPDRPPIESGVTSQVFVYGTLRQPVIRRLVVGRPLSTQAAILPGYRRQGLNLVPELGAWTVGEVFAVDAETLRRLDRYERLGVRYQRIERRLASGEMAWVYRRLDDD